MVCIIVATKRPFSHKSVRARPFKRYRTAEPNPLVAKPNTYPDAKHTSEITVVDDESQPLEEPNSSRKEISESVSTLQMAYYLFLDRQVCKSPLLTFSTKILFCDIAKLNTCIRHNPMRAYLPKFSRASLVRLNTYIKNWLKTS